LADCIPSALNIPQATFPCVYPDNRATFRVVAPDAQKMSALIGRRFDMAKASDGVRAVTSTWPADAGFQYYSLKIDGAALTDSFTMTFFGSGWPNNDADAGNYHAKDVPHGHVSAQSYFSKAAVVGLR
jgi:hypothetical protein